ncbi:hypothetical protein GUJ93_ZPchr0003g18602 [Zizania palustris]|uniref:DUF7597 domain-containing protein n=1 Tax=Zizania palustris TaxID=103762 RepID=A0A8J5VV54_ZIZPA|nr:hypothetical protein GUJ93_ZPchr0003g18602 [Zizania palustris]
MANCPANHLPFLSFDVSINAGSGPERHQSNNVCISGHVLASHEEFTIASCNAIFDEVEHEAVLQAIHQHYIETLRLRVARYIRHPIGVGIF